MSKILNNDHQTALPQLSLPFRKEDGAESFDITFKATKQEHHKIQNNSEKKHKESKDQKYQTKIDAEPTQPETVKKASITLDFPSKKIDMFFALDQFDESTLTDLDLEFSDFLEPIPDSEVLNKLSTENELMTFLKTNEASSVLGEGSQLLSDLSIQSSTQLISQPSLQAIPPSFPQVTTQQVMGQQMPLENFQSTDDGQNIEKLDFNESEALPIKKSDEAIPKIETQETGLIAMDTESNTNLKSLSLNNEPHSTITTSHPPIKALVLQERFDTTLKTSQTLTTEINQHPLDLETMFELQIDVKQGSPVVISKPFAFETFIPTESSKEESPHSVVKINKISESLLQLSPETRSLASEKAEIHTLNGEFLQTVKEQFEKFQKSNDKKITVQMRANGKNLTIVFNSTEDDQINILFRTTDKDWQSLLHHSRDEIAKLLSQETIDIRYLGE